MKPVVRARAGAPGSKVMVLLDDYRRREKGLHGISRGDPVRAAGREPKILALNGAGHYVRTIFRTYASADPMAKFRNSDSLWANTGRVEGMLE